ncbi:MAG: hypothetical protein HWE18_06175 [Gammaproteobacteria bacterium]|nr:hypothetical protein [Gammaproteobacteria bacterium]
MNKSSNRFVTSVALAALVTFSSHCLAWFEPEYGVSSSIFSPKTMAVQEVAKYPYRYLSIKPLHQIPNDSTQRIMIEQLGAQGMIFVDTKSHPQNNLAQDDELLFSGRIFLKHSSIFEKFFAKADKQKCLLEVYIDDQPYIVFERAINHVYDFKCASLH